MKIPKGAKVGKVKREPLEDVSSITAIVKVTAQDIKKGIQGQQRTCAIARALARQFDEKDVRVVRADDITVDGFRGVQVSIAKKINWFIQAFDKNKTNVKPFSFKIKLEKD